jgi:signal transduction histidine kinase
MGLPPVARRWSLAGLTGCLSLLPLAHLLVGRPALLPSVYADGFALLLLSAVGVVGVGVAREESARFVAVTTAWTVAGVAGLGLLLLWTLTFSRLSGALLPDPVSAAAVFLAVGALVGLPVGLTDARRRQRASELSAERERMTFLNDLMRHNVLNAFQVVMGRADRIRERGPSGDTAADGVAGTPPAGATVDEQTVADAETILQWSRDAAAQVRKVRLLAAGGTDLGPVRLDVVLAEQATKVREGTGADVRVDDAEERWVRADEALSALFESLLLNAVEHGSTTPTPPSTESPAGDATPAGGLAVRGDGAPGTLPPYDGSATVPTVRVALDTGPDCVTVRVVDDGPGLPDAVRRAVGAGRLEPDVFGFGLYLASTLAERYGGSLAAGDDARGDVDLGGAALAVTLPRTDRPT